MFLRLSFFSQGRKHATPSTLKLLASKAQMVRLFSYTLSWFWWFGNQMYWYSSIIKWIQSDIFLHSKTWEAWTFPFSALLSSHFYNTENKERLHVLIVSELIADICLVLYAVIGPKYCGFFLDQTIRSKTKAIHKSFQHIFPQLYPASFPGPFSQAIIMRCKSNSNSVKFQQLSVTFVSLLLM